MADDNTVDFKIGTGFDIDELEKGLGKAEQAVIAGASKMFEVIEKNAQEQTAAIRKEEAEKIAIIEKSIKDQTAAIKARPDLDSSAKQKEIQAVKNAENAKIKAVKDGAKLQETAVKQMAQAQTKTIQDQSKKQLQAIQNEFKSAKQAVADFAKGAAGELLGLDQVLASLAGGPAAIGKLVVDMSKKAIAALNEMAEAWRQQEVVEKALENAANNNPYLNPSNVNKLKSFADEMQRMTGIDNVQILQTETRLASLGRNQQQIQKIVETAANMAATGVMDFDSAVSELNNSLNGVVRTSGRLYPELKTLSKEALASGQAIDIIAGKVAGSAAEAMKTGTGSVTAYKNAVGDLKKSIGQDWEQATRGFREAITNYIEKIAAAINKTKELKETIDTLKEKVEIPTSEYESEALIKQNGLLKEKQQELDRINQIIKNIPSVFGTKEEKEARRELIAIRNIIDTDIKNIQNDINAIKAGAVEANKYTVDNFGLQVAQMEQYATVMTEREKTMGRYVVKASNIILDAMLKSGGAVERERKQQVENYFKQQDKIIEISRDVYENLLMEEEEYGEEIEKLRKERAQALEEEIVKAKNINTLDDKRKEIELLKVQINFENDLLKTVRERIETDKKSDEERHESAQNFREENLKSLDEEMLKAILNAEAKNEITEEEAGGLRSLIKARKEGEALGVLETKNLSLQNQFLNANLQAYENLLTAAKEYIDGTAESEQKRFENLKTAWDAYDKRVKKEKEDEEDRKKRLADLAKLQEDLAKKLNKISEDAVDEAQKQKELAEERKYQEDLAELKKKSIKDAIIFEGQELKRRAIETAQAKEDELNKQLVNLENEMNIELAKYKENEEEKLQIKREFDEKKLEIEKQTADAIEKIYINLGVEVENIKKDTDKKIKLSDDDKTKKLIENIQKYLSAAGQIANDISTIWHNVIDNETEEKLKANNEEIKSDEDKARKEKEIIMKAAQNRYEADLFAWASNSIMAAGNAAMAVLARLAADDIPGAIIAGVLGAMQTAVVISAKPKPPRFHEGGVVQGRSGQDVNAVLKQGEVVSTQSQFKDIMQGFSNLANMKSGGQPQMKVDIHNSAANMVTASTSYDTDGLKVWIKGVTGDGLSKGEFDNALIMQQWQNNGRAYT